MPSLLDHLKGAFKQGSGNGAFVPAADFDRVVDWRPGALPYGHRSSAIAVDANADGLIDVVYTANETRAWIPQVAKGRFGSPVPIASGNCFAAADLAGDAAWDLVCTEQPTPGSTRTPAPPRLHLVEGYVAPNGETGIYFDRTHLVTDDPAVARLEGITIRDFDNDGRADIAACALVWPESVAADRGWSWVFWREADVGWTPQKISRGECFTFAVLDYDGDSRPDLHMLTENGQHIPGENENVVLLQRPGRTWERADLGGEDDPRAYLGGAPTAAAHHGIKGTPMGWALWDVEQDGAPEVWLVQGEENTSPLFRRDDRGWHDARGEIPGFAVEDPSAYHPGILFHWGAVAVDLDGNGLDDLVASEGSYEEWRPYGLRILLHQVDQIVLLEREKSIESKGFYGLSTAPIFGVRPDLLSGAFEALPRLWENRLDRAGSWLILKLLGPGGESARVEIVGCGRHYIHHPNAYANPRSGSPPWVIRGMGACDTADVTVSWFSGIQSYRGLTPEKIWRLREGVEAY